MTEHTPAPWQYYAGVVDAPINGTSPPTLICEGIRASERGYGTLAERQARADADGNLISAAPDLMAAAENAYAVMIDPDYDEIHDEHKVSNAIESLAKRGITL